MNAPLTLFELSEQPHQNGAGAGAYQQTPNSLPNKLINRVYPTIQFSDNPANVCNNPAWNKHVPDMKFTINHGVNVAVVAIQLGARMGLSAWQLSYLFGGGLLHDVSKFEQDPDFLYKADTFTDEDKAIIKPHAEHSAHLVENMTTEDINAYLKMANNTGRISLPLFDPMDANIPRRTAQIIRQHHEHFDGSGYPEGKKGKDILLLARILTVADVFAARIEEGRDYDKRMTPQQALDYMQGKAKAEFDPEVLEKLEHYVHTVYSLKPKNNAGLPTNWPDFATQEEAMSGQLERRYIHAPISVHTPHYG